MSSQAIMSRLKQTKISQSSFAKFANELNFWKFVRKTDEYNNQKNKILEDVFEAFIGCLEYLIDKVFVEHLGYGIVYNLMKNIMDKIDETVSLEFEDIYDAKSKLNIELNKFKSNNVFSLVNFTTFVRGKSFTTSSLLILQDGNVAKARGCSGAIRVAYPSFFSKKSIHISLSCSYFPSL